MDNKYIIVDSNTASDLVNAVNHFIKQGYTPIGGPVIDAEPEYLSGKYKQAMLRRDTKNAKAR